MQEAGLRRLVTLVRSLCLIWGDRMFPQQYRLRTGFSYDAAFDVPLVRLIPEVVRVARDTVLTTTPVPDVHLQNLSQSFNTLELLRPPQRRVYF